MTHDSKWVDGFSGFKNASEFLEIIEKAEATPYLQATKAVRKKLAGFAATAGKAAKRSDWKSVIRMGQAADKTTGRCPERIAIAEHVQKARAWAAQQLEAAVRTAQSGGDLKAASTALSKVRRHFSGEPEADDAAKGLKALKLLALLREAEAGERRLDLGRREKFAKLLKDTRWAKVFDKTSEG